MEKILINTKELQDVLGVSKNTAIKIGDEAGARVQFGKLLRWNVEKLSSYLKEKSV